MNYLPHSMEYNYYSTRKILYTFGLDFKLRYIVAYFVSSIERGSVSDTRGVATFNN